MRKHLRQLHERSAREQHKEFLAEGVRVCSELLRSRWYRALVVVVRAEAGEQARQLAQELARRGAVLYTASERQFRSICQTETPQDIVAVVSYPHEEPVWGERIVVIDRIADPGNLGTIVRTAVWFGWQTLVVMPGSVDVYNPKVVRSSAGALFHAAIYRVQDAEAALAEIERRRYVLLGAEPAAGVPLERVRLPRRVALAVGNEAEGLSEAVRQRCRVLFRIPGSGAIESLNVAIATAIVLYHFWHQDAAETVHARSGSRS